MLPMGPPDVAGPRRRRRGRPGRRRLAGQDDFDGPWIVAQGREGLDRDRQQRLGHRRPLEWPGEPHLPTTATAATDHRGDHGVEPLVNRIGEGNLAGRDLAPEPLAPARPGEQAEYRRERRRVMTIPNSSVCMTASFSLRHRRRLGVKPRGTRRAVCHVRR